MCPVMTCRVMPESPKWLLSVGRIEEAERVVREAARYNNLELPLGELSIRSTCGPYYLTLRTHTIVSSPISMKIIKQLFAFHTRCFCSAFCNASTE